jgi:hypothetical protein
VIRVLFSDDGCARARQAIANYFSEGERFTGSQFERQAGNDRPNEITTKDFVAVTMLGVDVPARPALWLLDDVNRASVRALLETVPQNVDIWNDEAGPHLAPRGSLWQLWDLLGEASWPTERRGNGMGMAKRSKLIAAKRPRLVPVVDKIVRDQLGPSSNWWRDFQEALRDQDLRNKIAECTQDAPPEVSLLRRLDVVVWIVGKAIV